MADVDWERTAKLGSWVFRTVTEGLNSLSKVISNETLDKTVTVMKRISRPIADGVLLYPKEE